MAHKILCALDGTKHGERALELATELAQKTSSELMICTVNVLISSGAAPIVYSQDDAELEEMVTSAAERARAAGIAHVGHVVLRGLEAAASLIEYADDGKYDIIVTGTGSKKGLARLMLGSCASAVAARAHCSVLVAR